METSEEAEKEKAEQLRQQEDESRRQKAVQEEQRLEENARQQDEEDRQEKAERQEKQDKNEAAAQEKDAEEQQEKKALQDKAAQNKQESQENQDKIAAAKQEAEKDELNKEQENKKSEQQKKDDQTKEDNQKKEANAKQEAQRDEANKDQEHQKAEQQKKDDQTKESDHKKEAHTKREAQWAEAAKQQTNPPQQETKHVQQTVALLTPQESQAKETAQPREASAQQDAQRTEATKQPTGQKFQQEAPSLQQPTTVLVSKDDRTTAAPQQPQIVQESQAVPRTNEGATNLTPEQTLKKPEQEAGARNERPEQAMRQAGVEITATAQQKSSETQGIANPPLPPIEPQQNLQDKQGQDQRQPQVQTQAAGEQTREIGIAQSGKATTGPQVPLTHGDGRVVGNHSQPTQTASAEISAVKTIVADAPSLKTDPIEIRREVRDKLDVTPRVPSVFYSGPEKKYRDVEGTNNHAQAETYALATSGNLLDRTEAGQQLSQYKPSIYVAMMQKSGAEVGFREADGINRLNSRDYATKISGEVKTFVAGAGPERVFRTDEIPTLMQNQKIATINGVDKKVFAEIYQEERRSRSIQQSDKQDFPRTYRAIALAEIRQDKQQALRTGDPSLIRSVVARDEVYKAQQAKESPTKSSQQELTADQLKEKVDQRTDKLLAHSQGKIKAEAQERIGQFVDDKAKEKNLTPEQAAKLKAKLEGKLEDPTQAYKLNAGLKMAGERKEAIDKGDFGKKNEYMKTRADYIKDTQLINASKGIVSSQDPRQRAAHRQWADRRISVQMQGTVRARKDYLKGNITKVDMENHIKKAKDDAVKSANKWRDVPDGRNQDYSMSSSREKTSAEKRAEGYSQTQSIKAGDGSSGGGRGGGRLFCSDGFHNWDDSTDTFPMRPGHRHHMYGEENWVL